MIKRERSFVSFLNMKMLSMFLLLAFQREGRRNFNILTMLEEANPMQASKSEVWWLNSGGYFFWEKGISFTIQGSLPEGDKWRLLYDKNNPRDTDNGTHPQNIFRLVNRGIYENFSQEVYFQITALNLSESENRNESNGVLLFNRYQDGDNLYYTGIRVDGHPVVKKKIGGVYYTLSYPAQTYPGQYDLTQNPTLLPTNKWVGIRSVVRSQEDGSTLISFYLDLEANGTWLLAAEARDDGRVAGAPFGAGMAGIRTDFMDVRFKGYKLEALAVLE